MNMSRHYFTASSILFELAIFLMVIGCYPAPPPTTVQRVNSESQIDLSGEWNDTDANQVAQVMIQDCLSRPWSAKFKQDKSREPVLRLYPIRNRSSEHINWQFFTKQVEMELINSGVVKVVSAWDEAQTQRFERADQAENASDKTVKTQGEETGSDFTLNGWIITQNDAVDGQEVRAYVTTMELTNAESNEKVWMKVHKIKKVINRAPTQW
jgi:PBP1b-binding outer membrane lipoprotein LpoB